MRVYLENRGVYFQGWAAYLVRDSRKGSINGEVMASPLCPVLPPAVTQFCCHPLSMSISSCCVCQGFYFYFYLFVGRDGGGRTSLCRPGWAGTSPVVKELRAPPATASPMLGLKAGTLGLSLLTKHFVLFFVTTGSGMPLCFLQFC